MQKTTRQEPQDPLEITNVNLNTRLQAGFMLGDIMVCPEKSYLVRDNEHYHVSHHAMDVLMVLASYSGKTMNRRSLLLCVWGDPDTGNSSLTNVITELRHALDDNQKRPKYIQTLPRKGYRLLTPVTPLSESMLTEDIWSIARHLEDKNPKKPKAKPKVSFAKFRRSRLFKIAAAYIVMAWILVQVVSVTVPIFSGPAWIEKVSMLLLLMGFPLLLIYNWWAELRLAQLFFRQTEGGRPPEKFTKRAYRDLLVILGLAGCCSIISFFLLKQMLNPPEVTEAEYAMAAPKVSLFKNGVSVMPFSKVGDLSQAHWINALHSELLVFLSQSSQLKVTSERLIAGLPEDASLEVIRNLTRAQYLLEGQVRSIGSQYRISTTLIDSTNGYQLWASSMNVSPDNLLLAMETLSRRIYNALTFLMPQDESDKVKFRPTNDIEAYDHYVTAKAILRDAYNEEQFSRAEALFLKALERDSSFELAEAGLCRTYLQSYELTKQNHRYEQAQKSCLRALNGSQLRTESEVAIASLYLSSGQYALSAEHFSRAQQLQPDNSIALAGRASALAAEGQDKQAEALFLQAIQMEPGYWRHYQAYGGFLLNRGRYAEAGNQYQQQIRLQPQSEQALSNLGAAYFMNLEFEKAAQSWQKALAIRPDEQTYSNLGTALYFGQQFDQAADMYAKAVELSPADFQLKANLADTLKYASQTGTDAKTVYRQALNQALADAEINPNDIFTQANIARFYSELGECNQAVPHTDKVLNTQPDDPYIFYDLALTASNCGQPQIAMARMEKMLQLGYPLELLKRDSQFAAYQQQLQAFASDG